MPSSLRLEPIRLATGNAVELTAGASIPATGVTVLNGSGQHVIRGFLAGEKQSFSVVQRLWRLHAQPGASPFLIILHFYRLVGYAKLHAATSAFMQILVRQSCCMCLLKLI